MRKTKINKKQKPKKEGFTLVELLAVIIILAIVVGITIPAVLITTNKTKQKTFETAAQTVANWVDRQYEVYSKGLNNYGVATLDPAFEKLCIRTCGTSSSPSNGEYIDYAGKSTDLGGINDCSCDKKVTFLTSDFIISAGLQSNNIEVGKSGGTYQTMRIRQSNGNTLKTTTASTAAAITGASYNYTRVYINANTGKSCVTLKSTSSGDYPASKTVCGGTCQSTSTSKPDYCKSSFE